MSKKDKQQEKTDNPESEQPEKVVPTEMEILQKQNEEYLAGWQRAQADYQNLVRETGKQKSEFIDYANQNLILSLLPILDNFKLAYNQIPGDRQNDAWVVGFSYIKKQLTDILTEHGVEEIKTVGEKFDLHCHEAVATEKDESQEEGIILAEKKPGYKLKGKVIQVAKVVVGE